MRAHFLLAASLLLATPAIAGTEDQGRIEARGTVTGSCSVDDLTIQLQQQGDGKLRGSGQVAVSQTTNTEWTIGRTERQNDSGSTQFDAELNFRGPGNMQLQSKHNKDDKKTVNGLQQGNATVDVTLTPRGGTFAAGVYQTQTIVKCVVK